MRPACDNTTPAVMIGRSITETAGLYPYVICYGGLRHLNDLQMHARSVGSTPIQQVTFRANTHPEGRNGCRTLAYTWIFFVPCQLVAR